MSKLPGLTVIGILLAFAAGGSGLLAQSSGEPTKPEPPANEHSPDWDIVIVNGVLDQGKEGGRVDATLGNVIDYLRNLFPANVVLAPGAGEIVVRDLKLAAFEWENALEALRVASGNAFVWKTHPGRGPNIDPNTGMPLPAERSQSDLFLITPDESGSAARNRMVEVFNLSGFLQGQDKQNVDRNLNEILKIIGDTMGLIGEKELPTMRFHPGASLLVVTGGPASLEVARKVILALPQVSASRAVDPAATRKEEAEQATREQLMRRYGIWQNTPNPNQPGASAPGSSANQKF